MRKIKSSKKSKLKISACYIVKNEAKNLPRSIESLKSAVNELIVVDTGSTDNTIEIAKSYGAKVIEVTWQDDFSAPRNIAIENATGDWIIFLDADEFFAYPDKVRAAIEKLSHEVTILIPRINIDEDNENREINRNRDLRIFKNVSYLRYRGMIHENLENIKGGELKYVLSGDDLTAYHTGYSASIHENKYRRNLRILELEVKKYGHRAQQDMAYANCYAGLGDWEKCLSYAKKALHSEKPIITNPEAPYIHILKAMHELNYPTEEILTAVNEAIKALPNIAVFYNEQGVLLNQLNRSKEANESFCKRDIIRIEEDIKNNGHKPQHDVELASCYSDMGNYETALKYAKAALKSGLQSDKNYRNIIKSMYLLNQPVVEILKITNEAIKNLPQCPEFYAERGMILCYNNRLEDGYSALKKSLQVWNQMPEEVRSKVYFARIAEKIYAKLSEIKEQVKE